MGQKPIFCVVAALLASTVACKKDSEPKEGNGAETVTQSAKPGADEKAEKPTLAQGEAVDQAEAADSMVALEVGDPAPALTLSLSDGKTADLGSLGDQKVVVYFYPKDDTPGCTVEAQGIRDQWAAFEKANVKVFGVSMQDAASHQAFIEKHQLPFSLVVDDGTVTKAFGVPVRGGEYASRHTFLISDGKIARIWREVDPAKHAAELLEAATALAPAPDEAGDEAKKPAGEPG